MHRRFWRLANPFGGWFSAAIGSDSTTEKKGFLMSIRVPKKAIEGADFYIDRNMPRWVFFPYPEQVEKVAYSCNKFGNTGSLFRGVDSGFTYGADVYRNDSPSRGKSLREAFGFRERESSGTSRRWR